MHAGTNSDDAVVFTSCYFLLLQFPLPLQKILPCKSLVQDQCWCLGDHLPLRNRMERTTYIHTYTIVMNNNINIASIWQDVLTTLP